MLCLPFSSLHLCLLWLEEGVWGQSALVLLNGCQMTKKLEAFRSWQVVVCARFFFPSAIFFLLQMFFVSLFSVKLSRQHNKCSRFTHVRRHAHTHAHYESHTCVNTCAGFCVFSQETDLILCSQIGGNGRRERSRSLTKTSSPPLIIETGFDCLFGNRFSNSCNDDD